MTADPCGATTAHCVDFDVFEATTRSESNTSWDEVRGMAPVVRSTNHGQLWMLTRYDEVCAAFRDWETFTSARTDPEVSSISVTAGRAPLLVPEELDPPEWHGYRKIVAELLPPRTAEALRSRARHWSNRFLDSVIASGRCDLVKDLAVPVPAAVIMEFLGFPEADWMPVATVFHDVTAYPPGHPTREAALPRYGAVLSRIAVELAERRAYPRDDALTTIAAATVDDAPIDEDMAALLVFMVLGGGVDTTTSLVSAALVHIGADPGLREKLRADPGLLTTATEEFLRVYPPARTHTRTVARDTEVAGCTMRAGDRVLLSEISANYDELAFEDPHEFKSDRFPNRHVSFGMGRHRCPGSHLARVEFTEMITAVLSRMPDFQFDGDGPVEYPSWAMVGGWSSIPVSFSARDTP
ncbi:cytochrome P450 [Mycolicibacterium moriokaense]|uniref:Cytochrome P450 n=1 Tax=Mycolicibacterium moriokaense TaxID=39691 RepID=A0A318H8M9_9MYCO|nr:cytochrome P450 [Mycolicibacterium moriokaense]PXX01679.1 cytochrome P450 [Mycolicibacterium moriokaense]